MNTRVRAKPRPSEARTHPNARAVYQQENMRVGKVSWSRHRPFRTAEGFWACLIKSPTGCWLYPGRPRSGSIGGRPAYSTMLWEGRRWAAHRLAWTLANGPIPEGMNVCHHCDTPLCCRPDHLFLGTHTENHRDAELKGRLPRGEKWRESHPPGLLANKLTLADIPVIRRRIAARETYVTIARSYGVTPRSIRLIAIGETWKGV